MILENSPFAVHTVATTRVCIFSLSSPGFFRFDEYHNNCAVKLHKSFELFWESSNRLSPQLKLSRTFCRRILVQHLPSCTSRPHIHYPNTYKLALHPPFIPSPTTYLDHHKVCCRLEVPAQQQALREDILRTVDIPGSKSRP